MNIQPHPIRFNNPDLTVDRDADALLRALRQALEDGDRNRIVLAEMALMAGDQKTFRAYREARDAPGGLPARTQASMWCLRALGEPTEPADETGESTGLPFQDSECAQDEATDDDGLTETDKLFERSRPETERVSVLVSRYFKR